MRGIDITKKLKKIGIVLNRKILKLTLKTAVITLIFVLAVWIRMLPVIRYGPYLSEYDTYYQYRMTKYILDNGLIAWFNWYDEMSWYPTGRNIPITSYLGVPLTTSTIYTLIRILGFDIDLMELCAILPAVFGGLTTIVIYFIGRELDGDGAGMLASLLIATSPAFIQRTIAGFFDNECVGFLAMTLSLLFWIKSMKENTIVYPVLSGTFLAYMNITWGGSIYLLNLYAAYALLMVILKKYSRKLLINYTIATGISLVISSQYPYFARKYFLSYVTILPIISALILALKDILQYVKDEKVKRIGIIGIIAIGIVGVIFFERMGLISAITGRILTVINPFQKPSIPLVESVAEHQTPSWAQIYYQYGFLIPLAAVGVYHLWKRGSEADLLMAFGGLTSAYFASTMARLIMLAAPFITILASHTIDVIYTQNIERILEDRRQTRRRKIQYRGTWINALILFITSLVLIAPVISWRTMAITPQQIITSSLPVSTEYMDWIEALLWMKTNLPNNAVVAAWWDYGYWITTIANKTTLADNATLDEGKIKKIALAFLSNETQALKILKEMGATHVVVFEAFDPNVGFLFAGRGWGDFVKSYWMAKIAGLNVTDYMVYNSYYGVYLPTGPKASQTTLYRLIFNTRSEVFRNWGVHIPKPENFELIFQSSNGYVFVYKIKY
ncbi:MAG: dolichyl-diphosphooligosaccharide--protein glycosyltransferase subunit STT3 [Candidatus Methanomethylicia archaeon]|nr:dolichyl-diphosphooligosaccharide--protein glycosyltransferase subunit STT3 [Candidatus Methanomethylicia archaeon]